MGDGSTPLWQWPLQSPRRLLATLAVAAGIIVALALLLNSPGRERTSAAAPAPAASPSSSTTAPTPTPSPSLPTAKDYGLAIDTARAFVEAWADHNPASEKAWYAGAAQYATDTMALQLTTVDYRNVPANRINGTLRLTDTGAAGRTEVAVPTDGGIVSVALVQDTEGGWKVNDLQPGAQAVR